MMSYHVGQVLFVILNKKTQVYPMMVVEELIKKTMQGEETNYILQGGQDVSTTILLNHIDGEIFESSDEAKYTLINRATTQIEKIIDNAVEKAIAWYSLSQDDQHSQQEVMSLVEANESTEVKVELPDGSFAKLKNIGLAG
jgi:hypothetical protein